MKPATPTPGRPPRDTHRSPGSTSTRSAPPRPIPPIPPTPTSGHCPASAGTRSTAPSAPLARRSSRSSTPASTVRTPTSRVPSSRAPTSSTAPTARPTPTATARPWLASSPRPRITRPTSPASATPASRSCRSPSSTRTARAQDSAIIEGIVYAVDHGADVISMSFSLDRLLVGPPGGDRLRLGQRRRPRGLGRQRRQQHPGLSRRRPRRHRRLEHRPERRPQLDVEHRRGRLPRRPGHRHRHPRRRWRHHRRSPARRPPRPKSPPRQPCCARSIRRPRTASSSRAWRAMPPPTSAPIEETGNGRLDLTNAVYRHHDRIRSSRSAPARARHGGPYVEDSINTDCFRSVGAGQLERRAATGRRHHGRGWRAPLAAATSVTSAATPVTVSGRWCRPSGFGTLLTINTERPDVTPLQLNITRHARDLSSTHAVTLTTEPVSYSAPPLEPMARPALSPAPEQPRSTAP